MKETLTLVGHGVSVQGKGSKANADAFLVAPEIGLFMVCDGVSGHAGATAASLAVCETMKQVCTTYYPKIQSREVLVQALDEAVQAATKTLFEKNVKVEGNQRPASTLVAVWFHPTGTALAHVGDSRAYLIRNGKAQKLTEDHSVAADMVRKGQWTAEQAAKSPYAHTLSRAMGMDAFVEADLLPLDLSPGDRMVLCSDGVWEGLSDSKIASEVSVETELDARTKSLVKAAFDAKGRDDTTVVAIDVLGESASPTIKPSASERLELLAKTPLFKYLSPPELMKVIGLSKKMEVPAGGTLIEEGTQGQDMYVVMRGKLEISKLGTVIAVRGGGEMIGEMAMIEGGKRFATVKAVERCYVLRILRDPLFNLMQKEPRLAVKILWSLCRAQNERIRNTTQELVDEKGPQVDEKPF